MADNGTAIIRPMETGNTRGRRAHTVRSSPAGAAEVLWVALRLGCTSFGGPVAHLGYFERHYVRRLRWLDATQYAALVAYCSALPGPTSSQVGFLIGLRRAGWAGALAAWVGFTLPSALLMYLAAGTSLSSAHPALAAGLHGLMLTAVAVVGHAVWSMQRTLCPDAWRRVTAAVACVLMLLDGSAPAPAVLAMAALAGAWLGRGSSALPAGSVDIAPSARPIRLAIGALIGSGVALAVLTAWRPGSLAALAGLFFKAGLLVFGGGHVVLPLLQAALVPPGWVSEQQFLSAYGLAQAMPGPLFAVAADLGALASPSGASAWFALVALCALFLPGLLACVVALAGLRILTGSRTRAALAGVNAGVVGVLAAAFCNPVWRAAVHSRADVLVVAAGFGLLLYKRLSPLWVVSLCVAVAYAEERLR